PRGPARLHPAVPPPESGHARLIARGRSHRSQSPRVAAIRRTMAPPLTPALPPLLDLAGTAVFALSGALVAARLKQTFVTLSFFALVTGVGGGTVRDLLIGVRPFWLYDPWVAPVIFTVALIAWFTPRHWWEGKL